MEARGNEPASNTRPHHCRHCRSPDVPARAYGPWPSSRSTLPWSRQLGYESVWTQHGVFATSPNLDPFTLLAFAASCTRTIKLGISVVVLPYHDPVNVAKISASLDQISGGRLILGVGIGGVQ